MSSECLIFLFSTTKQKNEILKDCKTKKRFVFQFSDFTYFIFLFFCYFSPNQKQFFAQYSVFAFSFSKQKNELSDSTFLISFFRFCFCKLKNRKLKTALNAESRQFLISRKGKQNENTTLKLSFKITMSANYHNFYLLISKKYSLFCFLEVILDLAFCTMRFESKFSSISLSSSRLFT